MESIASVRAAPSWRDEALMSMPCWDRDRRPTRVRAMLARQAHDRRREPAPRTDVSEYDRHFWEQRWSQALREHGARVAQRPPNAHLTAEIRDLRPGRALDAGCGHGSDALWLATRGWQVTAVDFAATALAHARSTAEAMGPDVAERIDWVEADLATWTPQQDTYDLVACLYVHVAGSVEEMVQRMATGVARGGTLFLVGQRPSTRRPEP